MPTSRDLSQMKIILYHDLPERALHGSNACSSRPQHALTMQPLAVVPGDVSPTRLCSVCLSPLAMLLDCWAEFEDLDDDLVLFEMLDDGRYTPDFVWRQIILEALLEYRSYRFPRMKQSRSTDRFVVAPRRLATAVTKLNVQLYSSLESFHMSWWELPDQMDDATCLLGAEFCSTARQSEWRNVGTWDDAGELTHLPTALTAAAMLLADSTV